MIKKHLFFITCIAIVHINFPGGYWSQQEQPTEKLTTIDNGTILAERLGKTDISEDFLKEVQFISRFENKKMTASQASKQVDELFQITLNRLLKDVPHEHHTGIKQQFDSQIKVIKPTLLQALFPEIQQK